MNDRCGNLYENKEPLWKTGVKAGMLQKTNALRAIYRNIIEKKGDRDPPGAEHVPHLLLDTGGASVTEARESAPLGLKNVRPTERPVSSKRCGLL